MAELVTVNDRRIYFDPCPKHKEYAASGYLVLSCRRCIVRLATDDDIAALEGAPAEPEIPQWDSEEARESIRIEGVHRWIRFSNLISCLWCARVRNATSDERPCPGPHRVALRGHR